jgi:hypothetical protein
MISTKFPFCTFKHFNMRAYIGQRKSAPKFLALTPDSSGHLHTPVGLLYLRNPHLNGPESLENTVNRKLPCSNLTPDDQSLLSNPTELRGT